MKDENRSTQGVKNRYIQITGYRSQPGCAPAARLLPEIFRRNSTPVHHEANTDGRSAKTVHGQRAVNSNYAPVFSRQTQWPFFSIT